MSKLLTPEDFKAAGWTRMRWLGLARLVNHTGPGRWLLEKAPAEAPFTSSMQLRSPDGRVWEWRLQRGIWIKRVPAVQQVMALDREEKK